MYHKSITLLLKPERERDKLVEQLKSLQEVAAKKI
jgi:hypothetical protein